VQVLGLASGLDVQGLIDQLMIIEKQPMTTLTIKNSACRSQLSVWSDIKTRLLTLQERIDDLQVRENFSGKRSASDHPDIVSVSSGSSAPEGKYRIHVTSLATSTKVAGSGRMGQGINPDAPLNEAGLAIPISGGSFSINGKFISVHPETESLNDILAKINDPVDGVPGVSAAYNPETDKVELSSPANIQLGSGADTGNFLRALWLDGQTGREITGTVPLGVVQEGVPLDSARFKNPLEATGAGLFKINGVEINFDTAQDTLHDIMERINNSDAGVRAAYDYLEDTITFTAQYTGSKIIQMEDVRGNFLSASGLLGGEQNLGANAVYSIDEINGGNPLTASSNEISGIIPGVSFTLKAQGDAELTVEKDLDLTVTKLKSFVSQYNNVMGLIKSKLGKDGILQGDSTLQRLGYNLRAKTTGQVFDAADDIDLIAEIGISIDKEGVMTLDEEKLKNVLESKPTVVFHLFNAADGIAARLEEEIKTWTLNGSGIIPTREGSINRQIELNDKTIETMEERLEQRRQQLVKQFTIMEKTMASLTSQSNWLAGQLASLPGFKKQGE
jgi:flagellar hook-associated protein 2